MTFSKLCSCGFPEGRVSTLGVLSPFLILTSIAGQSRAHGSGFPEDSGVPMGGGVDASWNSDPALWFGGDPGGAQVPDGGGELAA